MTFDIESWVLCATRLLNMLNISTKIYENTTMICEVTAQTRSGERTYVRTGGRTDAGTDTQPKLQIVATMSRLPQAGSTKIFFEMPLL